jgi:hypothetical protein
MDIAVLQNLDKMTLSAAQEAAVQNQLAIEKEIARVKLQVEGYIKKEAQQVKAAAEFADWKTDSTQRPIVDQIKTLYTQGKFDEGDSLIANNPGLRNLAGLADFKLNAQSAVNNRELTNLDLKAKIHAAKDNQLISSLIPSFQQDITNQENTRLAGIQSLMGKYGIPTVKGEPSNPDLSGVPDDKVKAFKEDLIKNNLHIGTSTTQQRQKLVDTLIKAGVSPEGIVKAQAQADVIFKKEPPLSAEDLTSRDAALASLDERVAKRTKGNIFYTDPAQYAEEKQNVFNQINTTIKDGPMTVSRLRDKVSSWMDKGIEITGADGKPVLVKVPPKVAAAAFAASAETDTWFVNQTDSVMLEKIKEIMTSSMHKDARESADYLNANGPSHDRNKIKQVYRNNSGT